MTAVTHVALDGSRLDLAADLDLSRPFTSVIDLGVGGRRYELTAGPASLPDDVADAVGVGFTEELSYSGGTLLVGRAAVRDPRTANADDITVAAWRGRNHSLVTSIYNTTTTGVLEVLSTVRIREHAGGIAITPLSSTALGAATVLKEVPGLGLLEITGRTRDAVRELPSWSGLRLPAGELFQDTLSNGRPYFVLAAPEAMVTLLPLAGAGTADAVPALLRTVRVAVRAPRW